ncbi:MAG TPA: hypothetical protein PKD64_11965 [Pirellulaceae bacterium]|nr:hypothetical protein [Pirellulaceae bacterium]HMO92901.1 hypothetical protein [Pirellulaceae bacterium]HMP69179.1 hypothetical protein [Pirellulaceae bacterium]
MPTKIAIAQTSTVNVDVERSVLDSAYNERLSALAAKCDELGLVDQAETTRTWFVRRLPDRMYFFVPPESDPLLPPDDADRNVKFWYQHMLKIREEHAASLFALAAEIAEDDSAQAFQLLHEVLRENPGHEPARKALGYRRSGEGLWLRDQRRVRANPAPRDHDLFGWKRREYWKVSSRHFSIDCSGNDAASREAGLKLAEMADRWYIVWRQLFFDYWNRGQSVKKWIEGQSSDSGSHHNFEVVLFKDRAHYLTSLSSVTGIEISSGYYDDRLKRSFFYVDEVDSHDTWIHELTHQWFQETIPTRPKPAENSATWVMEGVAMFMESLKDHGTYITIGGSDATRLQYARLRFNRDQFFLPMETVDQMGREQFQNHAEVRSLYSQVAGVCHHIMLSDARFAFIELLKSIYGRRDTRQTTPDFLGSLKILDDNYQAWLLPVDSKILGQLTPNNNIAFSLPSSELNDADLKNLSRFVSLEWLELSKNPISDSAIVHLKDMTQLRQLFLDSTLITDAGAAQLAELLSLEQIDLAATAITDAGIAALCRLPNLRVLMVAKTKISDEGLKLLSDHPNLSVLDVRATNVTPTGIELLRQKKPAIDLHHTTQNSP